MGKNTFLDLRENWRFDPRPSSVIFIFYTTSLLNCILHGRQVDADYTMTVDLPIKVERLLRGKWLMSRVFSMLVVQRTIPVKSFLCHPVIVRMIGYFLSFLFIVPISASILFCHFLTSLALFLFK